MVAEGGSRALLKRLVPAAVRGVLWSAAARTGQLQQQVFERRLGVSTSGHDYLEDGLDSERFFYEGCEWLPVRRALKALAPGPTDRFLDIGSGRGQALLIAAGLPYGSVTGVELGEQWHREAEVNIARARSRLRCPDVTSIAADVLEWPFPDDVTTVFLYSPFIGEVFHASMARVFDSYDRAPRPLHLVYDFPWEHDWLMSTGRVVVTDLHPAQWPAKPWWWRSGWVITTYRVVGPGEGGPGVPDVRRRLLRPRRALVRWGRPNEHRFRLHRPGFAPLESRPPGADPRPD